jgi:fumarate hydratase subunit alpha
VNTKDNTPAVIHKNIIPGDKIKISVMAKGFGSENMSALKMLKPSDGISGIKAFVIDQIRKAGGSPCPPVVLGIGIGGTMEQAALLSKRQLLRPVGDQSEDEQTAALEKEILNEVNSLGMGAMGFPGDIYCLAVKIGIFPTHIAGLPVALNINCHAARHAGTEI